VSECKPLAGGGQRSGDERQGSAVQLDPIKPRLKPSGTKHLKPKCDILLSNSAFKSNSRRYTQAALMDCDSALQMQPGHVKVGWRSLTPA